MTERTPYQKACGLARALGWEKEIRDLGEQDDATLRELIRILEEPTPRDHPHLELYESLSRYAIGEARSVLQARADAEPPTGETGGERDAAEETSEP